MTRLCDLKVGDRFTFKCEVPPSTRMPGTLVVREICPLGTRFVGPEDSPVYVERFTAASAHDCEVELTAPSDEPVWETEPESRALGSLCAGERFRFSKSGPLFAFDRLIGYADELAFQIARVGGQGCIRRDFRDNRGQRVYRVVPRTAEPDAVDRTAPPDAAPSATYRIDRPPRAEPTLVHSLAVGDWFQIEGSGEVAMVLRWEHDPVTNGPHCAVARDITGRECELSPGAPVVRLTLTHARFSETKD